MNVDTYQQNLGQCFNGTADPNIRGLANQANDLTEMMKTGQINKEEYIELMEDIQRQANINNSVEHQQLLIHMNTAINGLISLAKLI